MEDIEISSFHIESHIKIWDPESLEIIVDMRA